MSIVSTELPQMVATATKDERPRGGTHHHLPGTLLRSGLRGRHRRTQPWAGRARWPAGASRIRHALCTGLVCLAQRRHVPRSTWQQRHSHPGLHLSADVYGRGHGSLCPQCIWRWIGGVCALFCRLPIDHHLSLVANRRTRSPAPPSRPALRVHVLVLDHTLLCLSVCTAAMAILPLGLWRRWSVC